MDTSATNAIVHIKGLSKQYPGFQLNQLDMTIPYGSIMGFIGENGAGKTTTMQLVLDLIQKDSGEVQLFGETFSNQNLALKERIGVVFSDCYLPAILTINQLEKIIAPLYQQWVSTLFQQYVEQFQLDRKKKIKDYSKGMKMKLNIALALAHHPQLLLLDEPTSGLDPVIRNEILDLFLDFIQDEQKAILFSSHITSDIEKVADYITFLHQGRLIFSEAKDEVLERYGILKCSNEAFAAIDSADIIGYHQNRFGCEVMVKDKATARQKYPEMVIDDATLEDIMLFYIQKEQK